jgi:hypothetical protein
LEGFSPNEKITSYISGPMLWREKRVFADALVIRNGLWELVDDIELAEVGD